MGTSQVSPGVDAPLRLEPLLVDFSSLSRRFETRSLASPEFLLEVPDPLARRFASRSSDRRPSDVSILDIVEDPEDLLWLVSS